MRSFLILLLLFVQSVLVAQVLTLVQPSHNLVTEDTSISFTWNPISGADFYQVQVATVINFSSGMLVDVTKTTNQLDTVLLSGNQVYWRVRSNDGGLFGGWSRIRSLTVFHPSELACLQHWLSAQTGVTTNPGNEVQTWNNSGTVNDSAVQTTAGRKPLLINNITEFNNKSAIRFDGINDVLDLDQPSLLGSVFVAARWNGSSTSFPSFNGLLTQQAVGGNDILFIGNSSQSNLWPAGSFGSNIHLNGVNTLTYAPMNEAKVLTGQPPAPVTYSNLVFGTDRNLSNRYWNGDVLEMITTCDVVSPADRLLIETYLNHKYAPPVNLGEDISITDNLCDTTLEVDQRFLSYAWSTGETGYQITVSSSGLYSVTTTDAFGVQTSDTIRVSYEIQPALIADTTICLGDTITWNSELSASVFTFLWQDASTDSFIRIANEQVYYLRVTDTSGCSFDSDTVQVLVDSMSALATLGSDTSICSGSEIGLSPNAFTITSYLWKGGASTPTLVIDTADTYWVDVINDAGCVASDTIIVALRGALPIVDFEADTVCNGDSTQFTDLSTLAGSNMVGWFWDFGDGGLDSTQNPTYLFETLTLNAVTLTVLTDSGCIASATRAIPVLPLPSASFTSETACANSDVQFTDLSTIAGGDSISDWLWVASGSDTFSVQHPTINFDTAGFNLVSLTITTNKGCMSTTSSNIEIFPALIAAFEADNTCSGSATSFSDATSSFSVIDWQWDFGDGLGSSSVQDPLYLYGGPGIYNVSLTVTNVLGCESTTTETVTILLPPTADFQTPNGCEGEAYTLLDASSAPGDSITSWEWSLNGSGIASGESAAYTFGASGNYNVTLAISTVNGCANEVTQSISVTTLPTAAFTFSPTQGNAPIAINFVNQSTGAGQLIWLFGDGASTNDESNPVHTYVNNGSYEVQLVAVSTSGCTDTAVQTLNLSPEPPDLLLDNLELNETVQGASSVLNPTVLLANAGAQTITSIDLYARMGNETTIIETWNGTLDPASSVTYVFNTKFPLGATGGPEFFCVEARNVNGGQEESLENNRVCVVRSAVIAISEPYPVPADEQIYIDIVLKQATDISLDVYNMIGHRMTQKFGYRGAEGLNTFPLKTNTFATGKYLLKVRTSERTYHKSFYVGR